MPKRYTLILLLLISPLLLKAQEAQTSSVKDLAPLIGTWEIDQEQMTPQGQWNKLPSRPEWKFEWALGGQAVIDHWSTQGLDPVTKDSIPVYGMNLRTYDPNSDAWNISWIETLNRQYVAYQATSTAEEFKMEGENISGREVRIRFFDYQPNSFKWEQAWTFDQGKNWVVISRMTAHRKKTR